MQIVIKRKWGFISHTIRRTVAGAWSDMHDSLRLFVFQAVALQPTDETIAALLPRLLNIPKWAMHGFTDAEIAYFVEHFQFLLDPLSTEPLIPKFTHKGTTYHFIKADFDDANAFEFAFCDEHYTEFAQNPEDMEALALLTAAITRTDPNTPNTDKKTVQNRAEILKTAPLSIHLVAMRYFEAIKREIHDAGENIGLFDNNTPDDSDTTPEPVHFGWWTAYRYIAKTGAFGDFEKVCKSSFWDVFKFILEEKQRENSINKPKKDVNLD